MLITDVDDDDCHYDCNLFDDGNSNADAAEFDCLQSFARIMMMIAVLT